VNFEGKRLRRLAVRAHDLAVGGEDEVVLDRAADGRVAAGGDDGVRGSGTCFEFQIDVKGERGGVESRAEVGGGRRKRDAEGGVRFSFRHASSGQMLKAGEKLLTAKDAKKGRKGRKENQIRGAREKSDFGLHWSFFAFELVERFQDGVDVGVEDQRGALLSREGGRVFFVRGAIEEVAAMKFQRKLGIFQDVPGKDQDNGLIWLHESLLDQFLQAGESDGGSGLAADAVGTNLCFRAGDFDFADLFHGSTGRLKHAQGFFPGCGVADADRGGQGVGLRGHEFFPAVFPNAAKERICAFGLNDGELGQARDEAEIFHLEQRFAECGGVSQISAGDDDVVGGLPIELLEEFDGGGLLAFEPVWIDGVEQVDGLATHEFVQDLDASVEVGADLAGDGAVVERLRELAPGNFAFGDKDKAAHAAAGSVGGHGRGRVPSRRAGDPAESFLAREGCGGSHAGVFERGGRVHALMFGLECVHTCRTSTTRKVIERSIAFLQRDRVVAGLEGGQKFAEAPDAADIGGGERGAAVTPELLEYLDIDASRFLTLRRLPTGVEDFEEVSAIWAAKVLIRVVGDVAAVDAAQAGDGSCGGIGRGWIH
jgi:hypothetical protein